MDAPQEFQPRRRALMLAGGALALTIGLPRTARADTTPLKIGMIGTGRVGSGLTELLAGAGHELLISSRHPEALKPLAERLGPRVRTGTPEEAARFGDVIVISVPYGALPQVGREFAPLIKGKVVLDTCNPFPGRDGEMANAAREKGAAIASAEYLPGVRLVRAFNTIPAGSLRRDARANGERIAVPLAADDAEALQVATRLVRDAGFEPVTVGGLARARSFDVGTPVFGKTLSAAELKQALGIAP